MRHIAHPLIAALLAVSAVTGVAIAGVGSSGPADDPEQPTATVEARGVPVREGAGPARVVVTRPPRAPARFRWSTADGTAAAGEDFTAATGLLQFRPGEDRKVVEIDVAADDRAEGAETFDLVLDVPPGLPGADQSAVTTVTILE
jgi:chitinase